MTLSVRILILSLLMVLGTASVPVAVSQTSAESPGQLRVYRFKQDDYRRRYRLYTPANEKALMGSRPLVLVIHGGGGTDRHMIKLDKQRWNKLADEHGFYVAYPNAVDKLWDFGEGLTSADLDNRVDDLAYFRRVITS